MDRPRPHLEELWELYVHGKQTYAQLAARYGVSPKTVQRRLDRVRLPQPPPPAGPRCVIVADTTYFGRGFGVLVLYDPAAGRALWHSYVVNETVAEYKKGLRWIEKQGVEIMAVVCDGRRGLVQGFAPLPVQLCHFHQIAAVTRYLTRNPRPEASKELRGLALQLPRLTKQEFAAGLAAWEARWRSFLDERAAGPATGKTRYTHRRLRSAHRSLVANLPGLYTFEELPGLGVPNTTNALDGTFSALKNKLRNHNGLSKARRMKFIDEFFRHSHRNTEEE